MKIVALYKEHSGVDYHRILLPLRYLPIDEGSEILQVATTHYYGGVFKDADLVIYSRECPIDIDQLLYFRSTYGFKIVVDVDDYWNLPFTHPLYDSWKIANTSEKIKTSIKFADYVTTTHEYLRDKIVAYNKNVEVLPNALPYDQDQFSTDKVEAQIILYSSGITHLNDLRSLGRFMELCRENGDIQKYQFCLAGYNPANKTSKDIWDKMVREAKKYGNSATFKSLPLHSYMNHYKLASVCIAPLEDSEFNRCKSNLKILEAGCKNVPILASAIHPYTEMPGVFLCKTQRDWYSNLKKLIKDPEFSAEQGKALGDHVRKNYNLKDTNKLRKQFYDICTTKT